MSDDHQVHGIVGQFLRMAVIAAVSLIMAHTQPASTGAATDLVGTDLVGAANSTNMTEVTTTVETPISPAVDSNDTTTGGARMRMLAGAHMLSAGRKLATTVGTASITFSDFVCESIDATLFAPVVIEVPVYLNDHYSGDSATASDDGTWMTLGEIYMRTGCTAAAELSGSLTITNGISDVLYVAGDVSYTFTGSSTVVITNSTGTDSSLHTASLTFSAVQMTVVPTSLLSNAANSLATVHLTIATGADTPIANSSECATDFQIQYYWNSIPDSTTVGVANLGVALDTADFQTSATLSTDDTVVLLSCTTGGSYVPVAMGSYDPTASNGYVALAPFEATATLGVSDLQLEQITIGAYIPPSFFTMSGGADTLASTDNTGDAVFGEYFISGWTITNSGYFQSVIATGSNPGASQTTYPTNSIAFTSSGAQPHVSGTFTAAGVGMIQEGISYTITIELSKDNNDNQQYADNTVVATGTITGVLTPTAFDVTTVAWSGEAIQHTAVPVMTVKVRVMSTEGAASFASVADSYVKGAYVTAVGAGGYAFKEINELLSSYPTGGLSTSNATDADGLATAYLTDATSYNALLGALGEITFAARCASGTDGCTMLSDTVGLTCVSPHNASSTVAYQSNDVVSVTILLPDSDCSAAV